MLALLNLLKQLFLQTKLKPGLCDIPMVDASTHLELLGFIQTFTGLQKPPAVAFFGKVCIGDIDQTRAFWKARTQVIFKNLQLLFTPGPYRNSRGPKTRMDGKVVHCGWTMLRKSWTGTTQRPFTKSIRQ